MTVYRSTYIGDNGGGRGSRGWRGAVAFLQRFIKEGWILGSGVRSNVAGEVGWIFKGIYLGAAAFGVWEMPGMAGQLRQIF